ncbi:MAG: hypothetical protein WBF17_10055 [Phycisphaerae bacterium]
MAEVRITTVRYTEEDARQALRRFVFGGFRAGNRAPRGLPPELVSEFIEEEIGPDSPPDAYAKALILLRFYERPDVVEPLRSVLPSEVASENDLRRAAFGVQVIAELDEGDHRDWAAAYFNNWIVPCPEAPENFGLLMDTMVALSPAGSHDTLAARIDQEVRTREALADEDDDAEMDYEEVAALQRNRLPAAIETAEKKRLLLAQEPADRRAELVDIYLGKSEFGDEHLVTWAARRLRREAMEGDPEPVLQAFAAVIDSVDPKDAGEDPYLDGQVCRAAQAILYLQGRLTGRQRELYELTDHGMQSFLWDDLEM